MTSCCLKDMFRIGLTMGKQLTNAHKSVQEIVVSASSLPLVQNFFLPVNVMLRGSSMRHNLFVS